MADTLWHKQTTDPLFPDVIWSLPENKRKRGTILLVGGSGQQFHAISSAYAYLNKQRIGEIKIAAPESLKPFIPPSPHLGFLPTTKTNTLARESVGVIKERAAECSGIFLCGEVGRSSQTTHALSALLVSSSQTITITGDAVDAFSTEPHVLLDRANTTVVLSLGQLQRLLGGRTTQAITHDMGLVLFVRILKNLALKAHIISLVEGSLIVYADGEVSVTKWTRPDKVWSLEAASIAAVLQAQHPTNAFEALTTAAHFACYSQN